MERSPFTLSMEGQDDLRQYACLRKFEKIVNQVTIFLLFFFFLSTIPSQRDHGLIY